MDVTPQVINEVEFHQKMRGYDPDEVDDFLERVAAAVEELQDRVRQAEQRAAAAERHATEGGGRAADASFAAAATAPAAGKGDDTESIRRTLVLAQRTADAAVKEAEDSAKKTLQNAQDQVQRLYTEAKEHARKLVLDAESDARKTTDDTRKRLVKEIQTLEETRDALRADQGILERHLDEQRLRLRSSIGALQRVLDDPGRLRAATPPELSGRTLPESVDAPVSAPGRAAPPKDDVRADPGPTVGLEGSRSPLEDGGAIKRAITGSVTFTPPDDSDPPAPGGTARASRGGRVAMADEVADLWAPAGNDTVDAPTQAVPAGDTGDDAYLNSLRKAMLDDTSASTLDPDEHRARARFGRRR